MDSIRGVDQYLAALTGDGTVRVGTPRELRSPASGPDHDHSA